VVNSVPITRLNFPIKFDGNLPGFLHGECVPVLAGLAAFDDPDAEPALRAAALSGPNVAIARLQYGAYLAREGMFEAAFENLQAARELDPEVDDESGLPGVREGHLAELFEATGLHDVKKHVANPKPSPPLNV
jgi:hypothetical protein